MLYAHMGDPHQLGGALVEGTNYKCGTKICYGSDGGATHAKFQELQQAANQVAAFYGMGQIAVDGFIGTQTVTLIREIASRNPTVTGALGQARGAFSKEVAAQNALELTTQLRTLLTPRPVAVPSPTIPSPTIPSPTTTAPAQPGTSPMVPAATQVTTPAVPTTPTTTMTTAATAPIARRKSRTMAIVGVVGGLAVIGTIIAVVAVKRSGH
jgi:hypothetical protein